MFSSASANLNLTHANFSNNSRGYLERWPPCDDIMNLQANFIILGLKAGGYSHSALSISTNAF